MLSDQQIQARLLGISGSDIGAIAGLNPYRTAVDVYLEKKGLAEPFMGNRFTHWGTALEPVIRAHFLSENDEFEECSVFDITLVHPEIPWMMGTPDGVLWSDGRRVAGLEVKTASRKKGWGEPGSDQIPEHYLAQCHWYMGVTGLPEWHVAVLFGGNEYVEYLVERNDEFIDRLKALGRDFYENHMLVGVPPDVANYEDTISLTLAKHPGDDGQMVMATAAMHVWAENLREAQNEENYYAERVSEYRALLKEEIGPHAGAEGDNFRATYKRTKDRSVTNWLSIVNEVGVDPEIIAKHTETRPGSRVFRFKWSGDNE